MSIYISISISNIYVCIYIFRGIPFAFSTAAADAAASFVSSIVKAPGSTLAKNTSACEYQGEGY